MDARTVRRLRYGFSLIVFSMLGGMTALDGAHAATPVSPGTDQTISLDSSSYGAPSTGTHSFSGLLRDASGSPNVGVILLHGRGLTPDSAVVHELRISLNHSGYTTLSLEEPVPLVGTTAFTDYVNDALSSSPYVFPELYARMRAAIDWFKTDRGNINQVVVIGFSMGSRKGSAFLAHGGLPGGASLPVIGYVGVGMYATSGIDPLDIGVTIPQWSLVPPVLDIYGSHDTNAVNTAAVRANAYGGLSGASANQYTQFSLPCDPSLTTNQCHKLVGLKGDDTQPLERNVAAWMACYASLSGTPSCQALPLTAGSGSSGGGTSGSGGGGGAAGITWLLFTVCLTLVALGSRGRSA